jgi:hypothetical protein
MTTSKVFLAITALSIGFASCSKMDFDKKGKGSNKATITSEQTLALKAGESITIALPLEGAHDGYSIVTQSKLASISAVDAGFINYTYTAPIAFPIGIVTDEVVVTNDHHAFPIAHNEIQNITKIGCGNGGPQHYIVNLHIQFLDADGNQMKK